MLHDLKTRGVITNTQVHMPLLQGAEAGIHFHCITPRVQGLRHQHERLTRIHNNLLHRSSSTVRIPDTSENIPIVSGQLRRSAAVVSLRRTGRACNKTTNGNGSNFPVLPSWPSKRERVRMKGIVDWLTVTDRLGQGLLTRRRTRTVRGAPGK